MFRVIETKAEVYNTTELILNGIDYNPATLIEDGQIYQLTNFSESGYCLDFLTNELNTVEHNQISKADLKKLCTHVKNLLMEEANVQPVASPVTICGDIHGNIIINHL